MNHYNYKKCPYCESPPQKFNEVDGFGCRSQIVPRAGFEYDILRSAQCEGRAEAIAELDAWHTGEPPENVQVLINSGDGCIVLGIRNDNHIWVDGFGPISWKPEYQWRQVRP